MVFFFSTWFNVSPFHVTQVVKGTSNLGSAKLPFLGSYACARLSSIQLSVVVFLASWRSCKPSSFLFDFAF